MLIVSGEEMIKFLTKQDFEGKRQKRYHQICQDVFNLMNIINSVGSHSMVYCVVLKKPIWLAPDHGFKSHPCRVYDLCSY